jgi:hypothetical protein
MTIFNLVNKYGVKAYFIDFKIKKKTFKISAFTFHTIIIFYFSIHPTKKKLVNE